MKIYVVGQKGVDHNSIKSIHKTYEGALKAWNKLRLGLLKDAKNTLKRYQSEKDKWHKEMYVFPNPTTSEIKTPPNSSSFILASFTASF